jgi:ribonuclease G
MPSELLVSRAGGRLRAVLVEDGRPVELRVEARDDAPRAGRIARGRVTDVVPGLRAAFVDIGAGRAGLLHGSDLTLPGDPPDPPPIQDRLRPGRELLVQVLRPGRDAKGPRLTTHLQFPGRLLVLEVGGAGNASSRRLPGSERQRLIDVLGTLPGDGVGWVARTAAESAPPDRIQAEAERLLAVAREVEAVAAKTHRPGTIRPEPDLLDELLRDAPETIDAIVLDDDADFDRAAELLAAAAPALAARLARHAASVPLFESRGVDDAFRRALRPRVWLPSGAFLMIETTEALVAIDVNTGKFAGARDAERTALRVNLEAAREIPRQLRLRDLSGLVVVDLLDMRERTHREQVVEAFSEQLRRDPVRTRVSGPTESGLLELTRRRLRPSLIELETVPCPDCGGHGRVLPPVDA